MVVWISATGDPRHGLNSREFGLLPQFEGAGHLMRRLHLDGITTVTVPTFEEKTIRDLVRSGEDTL